MKRSIMGALALVCAPSLAFAFRPVDHGGEVDLYIRAIIASEGFPHPIRGDCFSACTMFLGHRGACIERNARLGFHSAFYADAYRSPSEEGNEALRAFYPPRIRAYVDARGWLNDTRMKYMSGAQAIALGVPECR